MVFVRFTSKKSIGKFASFQVNFESLIMSMTRPLRAQLEIPSSGWFELRNTQKQEEDDLNVSSDQQLTSTPVNGPFCENIHRALKYNEIWMNRIMYGIMVHKCALMHAKFLNIGKSCGSSANNELLNYLNDKMANEISQI